jgi:putative peptidoglycan lipid II flippase
MRSHVASVVRNAFLMMAGTLASRVLGLAREIITAAFFGASRQIDAFNIAYTLANLLRQLLAEGALSAAFVPVFSRSLQNEGHERALSLARQAMGVLLMAGSAVVAAGIVLSPVLVTFMAPGFDAEKTSLAILLTRRLFPFLLIISLAALAMGVLNSVDSYFVPAIAPGLSNIVYIVILLIAAPRWGIDCLVAAVLAGGGAHFLLQWHWSARMGMTLAPVLPDFRNPDLRRMMALFFPYAAGLSLNQVNPIVSRMFGSFLRDGAISVLNYANRVIQLPLGLFVVAISQAVLPELSRCVSRPDEFREILRDSIRFALFIVFPVTVGLVLVSDEMVHLLFFRGAFSVWAWHATASSLALYSVGLPGMACTTVVMRGLYAKGLPGEALRVTLISVVGNLVMSFLLVRFFSFEGLAFATSAAFILSGAAGIFFLSSSVGGAIGIFRLGWTSRIVCVLGFMATSILILKRWIPYPLDGNSLARASWLLGIMIAGAIVYGGLTSLLGFQEWQWIRRALERKRSKEIR